MATVNKDFKIKNGLVVEGSNATVNGNQVLTETASDQYIIDLIGGETLVTSVESTQLEVINGELNVKANVFDSYGSASTAESNANTYTDNKVLDYTKTSDLDSTVDGYGYLKSADLNGYATETYADNAANTAEQNAIAHADALTTDDVSEGIANQYFTDSRARGAVSGANGVNYNSNTGEISAHLGNGLEFSINGEIQIDDSVVATETDLTNAISNHDVSTGVHGLAGDVVGTTDTQTISNKTLGSDLAAGGFQITNLGTPQNSTDAATKAYVDAVSEGLHVHAAARVAIQGNISIATGLENGDTAGGVTLATGDRVLVKDQTTASENGIYVVQASGQALRATDFDTATEVASGDFIFVSEGTYANTGWVQTNNPATIGTDPIAFTQFSGAGTYTAGNGLTLDGTEFKINESVTATVTYVGTEIGDHASDTATHGVTEIVGASENQTLTNKTLGSSTVLGANLDAANTYTVANLQEPVNNQDAATKFYVDGEISTVSTAVDNLTTDDVAEGTAQYFTEQRAKDAAAQLLNSATKTNISITSDPMTGGLIITAENGVADSTTDDLTEGVNNLYYTDARAKAEAAALLTNATKTNIQITADGNNNLTITAENGVDDATTDDLDEGSSNLYFTDQRAVDALEAVVPNFTAVEVNSLAKQIAATVSAPTAASQITAYSWAKADYRSAKFLVKTAYGTHTELTEVLITLDSSDNVAIVEYATVGTNGSSMAVTADVDGANVRLRVTPTNNKSTVNVVGTLLA